MGQNRRDRAKAELESRSKRNFLIRFAVSAGVVAGLASGLVLWKPLASKPLPDKWAFFRGNEAKLDNKWADVVEDYVPLCPEKGVDAIVTSKYEEFKKRKSVPIEAKARALGFTGATVDPKVQQFGRPLKKEIAESYRDYVKTARDYLFSRVSQLEQVPLEVVVLKNGQDFSDTETGKAFVGYTRHEVIRAYVKDNVTGKGFVKGVSWNTVGSHIQLGYNSKTNDRENYFVFFGSGYNALCSPISETIHLDTSSATAKHERRNCERRGASKALEEGITEGISNILTRDLIRELDIPNGERILEEAFQGMVRKPKYSLVPKSIAWLRKNGIDSGLEMYKEDPGEYLSAIQS